MLINFFKALIFPSYMMRFKSMNLFFAIAIFFLSSFVLAIPQMYYTNKERYKIIDTNPPYDLIALNELEEDALEEIRGLGVRIENGAIQDRGTVEEYKLYQFTSKDYTVFFAFDFYDVTDEDETFNEEVFENYSELEVEGKKLLIVFYLDFCTYVRMTDSMDIKYEDIVLDFKEVTAGKDLSYRFIDMFIPHIYRAITFHTFVSSIIYPLVIIILIWLLFKTDGNTLSFKTYYNIGSICAIIPLFLIFLFSWIFPNLTLMQYFTVIFGIYYLIMIVRINSKTKIA